MTKVLHIIGPQGVGKTNLAADICAGKRLSGMSCESLNDLGLFDDSIGDPGFERIRNEGFLPSEHHTPKVDMLILDYVNEPPAGFIRPGDVVLRMERAGDAPTERKPAVIFAAPGGWGKNYHIKLLKRQFSCAKVVDEWNPKVAVTPGTLHLTNCTPTDLADWRQTIDDQTVVIDAGFFYTAAEYFVPVAGSGIPGPQAD